MPRKSPFHIVLSAKEAAELNRRAVRYTLPYFEVVRAKMILMAAQGIDNDQIAARLDTRREVVSQWRKRFFTQSDHTIDPTAGLRLLLGPINHGTSTVYQQRAQVGVAALANAQQVGLAARGVF